MTRHVVVPTPVNTPFGGALEVARTDADRHVSAATRSRLEALGYVA